MKVDKNIVRQRFARSIDTYDSEAHVQAQISKELAGLLAEYCPNSINRILEIGAGTGLLTRELLKGLSPQTYFINDLVPESSVKVGKYLEGYPNINWQFLAGDMEELPLPDKLDLVVSASALQWFRDLGSFFKRASETLNPGGFFIFNTFGPSNFQEIRKLTGMGLCYPSIKVIEKIARCYFQVEKASEETVKLRIDSPVHVLKHMKATGVNGFSPKKWTKGQLVAFSQEYIEQFKVDDGVALTYHPIYFVLKK